MLLRAEGAERKITLMIWLRVCLVDAFSPSNPFGNLYRNPKEVFYGLLCNNN